MKESRGFSTSRPNAEKRSLVQSGVLSPLQVLVSDLATVANEIRLVVDRAEEYMVALEKLLDGKLTPPEAVEELTERLGKARQRLAFIREEFEGIEALLESTVTGGSTQESTERISSEEVK